MMREIDEPYWIAPALRTTDDPLEPLQFGGIKLMGIRKRWAPARSYGLLVRLDADLDPVESLHSRNDGKRHGITGAAAADGRVYIVSRGHGKLLEHVEGAE